MESSVLVTIGVALITAVIGPSVVELIKSRLKKKKDDGDPMFREMEADILINERLQEMLENLDCDRIWIMQFHNGGYYYASGISIKKFSIFYETVNLGISTIKDKFQNIPTSFFSKAIMEVHENGELYIENVDDESVKTYGLRDTMHGTGCQSVFMYGLNTPAKSVHGILGVEKVKEAAGFTDDEKEQIRELGTYVAGILELIHKFK